MKIKFVQNIIDCLRGKKSKIQDIKYFLNIQRNIENNILSLKEKIKNGNKIKVAFLHMYATDCQNLSIFEKMLEKDSIFDPYFIVNPDVMRSKENFDYNYKRSKEELIKQYGKERVLDGYDYEKNKFIDYTEHFDLATTNSPYDNMAHKYYKIEYWAKKHIPIFYLSYFYMGRCFVGIENLKSNAFSYMWKIFAENEYVLELAKKHQIIKGKNIIVSGSPKMDKLSRIQQLPRKRKVVIIAPHHSIDDNEKSVGGFLEYSNCLLELPQKYKEIDFVFRPHPLLFENLQTKYWGKDKTQKYLDKLLANSNVIYSTEGQYMELFANSDALIHDCGSFCAEYLYTNKPCAYMYKKTINPNLIWTDFGHNCINQHYIIKENKDIEKFIENVIIQGNDYKKESRTEFTQKHVAINYPQSTDFIIDYITKSFKY